MAIYVVPERTICSPRRPMARAAQDATVPVVSIGSQQRVRVWPASIESSRLQSAPAVAAPVSLAIPA